MKKKNIILANLLLLLSIIGFSQTQPIIYKIIGNVTTYNWEKKNVITYTSGMMIDADGAPKAYNIDNTKALDYLANAGKKDNWWALATENGKSNGKPLIQKDTDPAPGFYISMTSLQDCSKRYDDPNRYVNSETIPFIVLPPSFSGSFLKGDIALVVNKENKRSCYAIFADIGPKNKIGEGSICLAKQLGIESNPKKGGVKSEILYILIKNSGQKKVLTYNEIQEIGSQKLKQSDIDELMQQIKE
jgi:hypothetical protein